MQTDTPVLFIEINDLNYIFVVCVYDESQKLKIIEKILTPSEGVDRNKITNIDKASETIKKNIVAIEKKINHVFKEVILIIENFDYSCINVSGFKKLNGSQLLKENISYILNSLKLSITENEKQKTILHIFNSKNVLDGINVENLPIGLFGDFYNHELTFFLIQDNDLKNIKKIFSKNHLNVSKIILKAFNEGTQLIDENNKNETFFKIKIRSDDSEIIFFEQSSFKYSERFNFGTNIIYKDIEKICSIKHEVIENFFSENLHNDKYFDDKELLEEKYFLGNSYRKIRKKLIIDVASARIDEIISIILHENINLKSFKVKTKKVYINIQNKIIFSFFKENFRSYFFKKNNFDSQFIDDFHIDNSFINVANLSTFGWKKEAIPIIQTKNSLITRIFKSIFG